MKKLKHIFLIYFLIIGFFSVMIYWIVKAGKVLEVGRAVGIKASGESHWTEFLNTLSQNFTHPLADRR